MSGQCLLVVETDALNRKLYTDILQFAGYQTIVVREPCEIDTVLRGSTVDLVVTDAPFDDDRPPTSLGGGKSRSAVPPVLVVSAEAMPNDRRRILDAGYSGYLSKPINISEFLETVATLMNSQTADHG